MVKKLFTKTYKGHVNVSSLILLMHIMLSGMMCVLIVVMHLLVLSFHLLDMMMVHVLHFTAYQAHFQ